MNVKVQLEFELTYFEAAVDYFRHGRHGDLPQMKDLHFILEFVAEKRVIWPNMWLLKTLKSKFRLDLKFEKLLSLKRF